MGDTFCRQFSGKYVVNGSVFSLTEMAENGNECERSLSEQDDHVF
jgi:hypothetical protein